MKNFSLLFAAFGLLAISVSAQDSQNCELVYHWSNDTIPATTAHANVYNEIWGYEADGREYAIMGSTAGTHIFDITEEASESEIIFIEGAVTGTQMVHRDFHTYDGYLYTVADEGASTLQIIDLHNLPLSAEVVYDSSDLIQRAHNIFIDEEAGVMYRCGGNHQLSLYSLEDPTSPTLIINCQLEVSGWSESVGYCHDVFVEDGIAYCNSGGDGLWIVDFSTPTSPVTLGSLTEYEDQGYNHSGWLHNSGNMYALADETHGMRIKILDVSDETDIQIISLIGSDVHDSSIPHNLVYEGDFLHVSYYVDGYYVWNMSNPSNPQLWAFYDTSEWPHSFGYKGCWGVYPFLSSGKILVSDMQEGLFVLQVSPTSVADIKTLDVMVSPNPTTDKLSFTLPKSESKSMATIVNMNGEIVVQEIVSGMGQQTIQLPTNMSAGSYVINLSGLGYRTSSTFIKQ